MGGAAQFGLSFYNTSQLDLTRIAETDDHVYDSLMDYVGAFSQSVRDIWDAFDFAVKMRTFDQAGRLWPMVKHFSTIDMSVEALPNAQMGDLFEHVMYRAFNTKGKAAGAFYTPRDAIRLMVDILFASDDLGLTSPGASRTVYDPTAGTGGMLLVAERALKELNPNIEVNLAGQELMPTGYAIGKADLLIQGGEPDAIRHGDTLLTDLYEGEQFEYILSNPPFGSDWSVQRWSRSKPRCRVLALATAYPTRAMARCCSYLTWPPSSCPQARTVPGDVARWYPTARHCLRVALVQAQIRSARGF